MQSKVDISMANGTKAEPKEWKGLATILSGAVCMQGKDDIGVAMGSDVFKKIDS